MGPVWEDVMSIDGHDTPALSPIANSTRREVAVASIRRALLSGELVPGQRIKETAMAAMLGISRPTVREAMNQLISEGSLVQEPYKGVRVAQPSAQDLLDVAEIRVSLETLAALRVAREPEGTAMASLRAALRRHLDALQADDPVTASRTHLDLHRTLWGASGNRMLTKIWPLVESQIVTAMSLDQATFQAPARDAELHQRLIDVIASGDESAIIAEVRDHIGRSADQVVQLIGSPGTKRKVPERRRSR
jgi:DNA-binding GntR family transcriptional regulator